MIDKAVSRGIAKGYITKDWNEAKEYYARWVEEYGDLVEMFRENDIYKIRVLPYKIEVKK